MTHCGLSAIIRYSENTNVKYVGQIEREAMDTCDITSRMARAFDARLLHETLVQHLLFSTRGYFLTTQLIP